jgi:hypothetical protein
VTNAGEWFDESEFIGRGNSRSACFREWSESPALVVAKGTVRGLGYPRLQRLGESAMVSWGGKDGKEVKTGMISAFLH